MVTALLEPPPPSQPPDDPSLHVILGSLRTDPSLAVFLSPNFSPTTHTATALRHNRIQPALQDAQRASSILSANVHQEVIRRKDALLAEVHAVTALEKDVQTVSTSVSTLVNAVVTLSDALSIPSKRIRQAACRMQNLDAVLNLLRHLIRFRACTARLEKAHLFPTISPVVSTTGITLPPAADALHELELLIPSAASSPLTKIDGLSNAVAAVRRAAPELRKRVGNLLRAGIATRTETDVEAAILSFSSLNILPDRINAELARLLRDFQTALHRALELPSHVRKPVTNAHLASSSDADDVWTNVDTMLQAVAETCFKVILLQQVLSRRYCPVSHMSLLHDTIASNFIDSVSRAISEQVSILARSRQQRPAAAFVFLTLAEGYPHLRGLLTDIVTRVSAFARLSPMPITRLVHSAKLPLIPDLEFTRRQFFNAFQEVETCYISASLERLTKIVSSFFQVGKQPCEADVLMLTKVLAAELSDTRSEKQLYAMAVSNVAMAIRLFTSHAEDFAATSVPDDDSNGKVLGEEEEWRLTTLYNAMVTLQTAAPRALGEQEDGFGEMPAPIKKEVDLLSRLSGLLLDGPFSICKDSIRRVLKRMHTEDLNNEVSEEGCSVYVLEIAAQLSMFADGIIPGLARSQSLGKCTLGLAKWVVDSFICHVGLVFPVVGATNMRLSMDLARVELAVESLCTPRLLGRSYRALRALRKVILLPTEEFRKMDDSLFREMKNVGRSNIAHVLLGRSTNEVLKHPHRLQGVFPEQYVDWMERHSEEEAWKVVDDVVERYRRQNSGNPNMSVEYEAISGLSEKIWE